MSDVDVADVSVEARLAAMEARIEFLEKERPGRRMKPNVVSQAGVCGINPDQDSTTCPDASIYRYQQGCQGEKCVAINREYYAGYRAKRKAITKPTAEAVVEAPPEPEVAPAAEPTQTPVTAAPPWASAPSNGTQ